MIIDFHVHIWEETDPFYQGSPDDYVRQMDALGIDKMCILGMDLGQHYARYTERESQVRFAAFEGKIGRKTGLPNRYVFDFVRKHPDRLVGLGSLNPDSAYKLMDEYDRCVSDYGFRGFKFYPHSGFYPDDERLYPVYERGEKDGLVFLFHTGIKDTPSMNMKYNDPMSLDDLAAKFPELKIVMAHVGYPWVDKAIQIAFLNFNVFLELSGLMIFELFAKAPVVKDTLTKILNMVTLNEKTIFGSDGPRPTARNLRIIRDADYISMEDKKKILGDTAEWLLHCDTTAFREFTYKLTARLGERMAAYKE